MMYILCLTILTITKVTGEPLIKREDDNVDTLKRRLSNFHRMTTPLEAYFQK